MAKFFDDARKHCLGSWFLVLCTLLFALLLFGFFSFLVVRLCAFAVGLLGLGFVIGS